MSYQEEHTELCKDSSDKEIKSKFSSDGESESREPSDRGSKSKSSSDNESKRKTASDSTDSPSATVRRLSIKDAWSSIKLGVNKKRASLPDFRLKNIFRSPSPTTSTPDQNEPVQEHRPEDVEDAAFGEALIGLLKLNPRFHYLLDKKTRAECTAGTVVEEEERDSPDLAIQSE